MDSIRIEEFKAILALCDTVTEATTLEGLAFQASAKSGTVHGMPVWTYANGSTLFETERPEAHAREALSSYLDQVALVKALLQSASRQKLLDTFDLDIEPVGQFSAWRDVYYEDIRQSKAVLQERSEESAFIACVKCRSNAVDTEQKQTRSADEPMTIFCLCRKCGKRFTMH